VAILQLNATDKGGFLVTHNLPEYANHFVVCEDRTVLFDRPEALHDTDRRALAKALTALGVAVAIPVGKARQLYPGK
jgi:hypothetical protein